MITPLFHVAVLLVLGAVLQPSYAASFPCERAATMTEYTICQQPSLNDADVKMATTYSILRKLMPMGSRSLLQEEQVKWLQLRDQCQDNLQCLTEVYNMRQQKLDLHVQRLYQRGPQ